jgi:hypothetical protein
MPGFINGVLVIEEDTYITTSGDNNDIVLNGGIAKISTTNNMDAITGVQSQSGIIFIVNVSGTNNLILKNNSSSSLAANRIMCSSGSNITVPPMRTAVARYDSTLSHWYTMDSTNTKRQEFYSGTSDGSGNYTVVFANPFSVAPNIQCQHTNPSTNMQFIKVTAISTTGFTINAYQFSQVTSLPIIGVLGLTLLGASTSVFSGAAIDVVVTEK